MTSQPHRTAIDRLLDGIEAGAIPDDVFADQAVFDATVPNWRFSLLGAQAIRDELARWYTDPGHFQQLGRTPLPDGELVEFTLTWTERDVEHTCHQAHVLQVANDRVLRHVAFCGGRWPAALVSEMQRTQQAAGPAA